MYVFLLLILSILPIVQATEEGQSFKDRFLSVSMCYSYINELKVVDQPNPMLDPMLDACSQMFEDEKPLLAIIRNLLQNNSTFTECHSAKESTTLTKLKPIWNTFTETIENEKWMERDEICNLFTNKLNPLYCRLKKEDDKCESKMVESVYAFWYLYAQSALNVTIFEGCLTLPYSLIKMEGHPLNPKLYDPNFDLRSQKIVTGDVCMSHNRLWLKDRRPKQNMVEQKHLFGIGLRQFQHFGESIYDF